MRLSAAPKLIACTILAAIALVLAGPSPNVESQQTPISLGASPTNAPWDPSAIDVFAREVGRYPAIVMWYQDWYSGWTNALIVPSFMNAVTSRGGTPMITWEPWISSGGPAQPAYALRNVTRGVFDPYIRRAAAEAAAYRKPFYLRFAHEMNGDWSPWGRGVNGNTPADFIAAWRHVVSIFRASGATNAIWVWSPNVDTGVRPFADLYPGDTWVDQVALDGYNWGSLPGSRWKSLADVFGSSYDTLTRLTQKPVMIAETASTEVGGNKAAWITQGFLHDIPSRLPRVHAVIWFDRNKETDWRAGSSPAALAAFRAVAASPLYAPTAAARAVAARKRPRTGR